MRRVVEPVAEIQTRFSPAQSIGPLDEWIRTALPASHVMQKKHARRSQDCLDETSMVAAAGSEIQKHLEYALLVAQCTAKSCATTVTPGVHIDA